jgi:hypothetical protein
MELQRTPEEIRALDRLISESAMPALRADPTATWENQGREHERLATICTVLAWARDPANRPPDNPYTVNGIEGGVAAAVEAEGPYITAERVAEIRHMERAKCQGTVLPWAARAPANTPETRAALGWLLGNPCPVDEQGFTRGYRRVT